MNLPCLLEGYKSRIQRCVVAITRLIIAASSDLRVDFSDVGACSQIKSKKAHRDPRGTNIHL